MLSLHKLIFPVLLLLFLSACSATSNMTPVPTNPSVVEIDVTSGMPSPKWTLSDSEVEVIEQSLTALPPADSASLFDGLGYRGFVVSLHSPERLVRVQGGYISIEEEGSQKIYIDTDHQLEKWLLEASRPHIEPELYSFLEEGIGR